jgi:hypothetical protein
MMRMENNTMQLMISEIWNQVSNASTENEKIALLRKNNSPALREILRYAYHPNVKFFSETVPPFKADDSPAGMSYGSMFGEYRKFYIYLDPRLESVITQKGPTRPDRKRMLLIQMLEALHPSEAALFVKIFKRETLKDKKLTKAVVDKAFPGLLAT